MERREFLGVVGTLGGTVVAGSRVRPVELTGATAPPSGASPAVGSWWPAGRLPTRDRADAVLGPDATPADLRAALGRGTLVWLDGDLELDCTGERGLVLPRGCTLASDRDGPEPGARPGARLFVHDSPGPLLRLEAGSRLSGLRVEGPLDGPTPYDWRLESVGAGVVGSGVEIDRCLFRGWGHAGVEIGREGRVFRVHVHGCELLDNALDRLGYGIVIRHGEALVRDCVADGNRHAVACSGSRDAGYEVTTSRFGPRALSHVLDMHRGEELHPALGSQAGKYLDVHHNVFEAARRPDGRPVSAVVVRGTPLRRSRVVYNWFAGAPAPAPAGPGRPGDAVVVDAADFDAAGVVVADNWFGTDPPPARVGIPASEDDPSSRP